MLNLGDSVVYDGCDATIVSRFREGDLVRYDIQYDDKSKSYGLKEDELEVNPYPFLGGQCRDN